MPDFSWRLILVGLLVAFFVFGGLVNLRGPKSIVDDFVRWGYPAWFHIPTGAIELAAAVLIAFPATRAIGAALGGGAMLAAAGTLFFHREYAHALPALIVLGLTALLFWI